MENSFITSGPGHISWFTRDLLFIIKFYIMIEQLSDLFISWIYLFTTII